MRSDVLDICYLRLSQEDGDRVDGPAGESCSIASQRQCIRDYLERHGFDAAGFTEIADDGWSGTNMERPGMRRLLALVEAGRVRTVAVRDLSRFARNYLEAGHYLEFVFPARGVRFISVNDGFDSADVGESTGGLELAVKNLLNQMYSRDISRKVKSAVDLKKLSGEYVYGAVPYGYKKGKEKNTIVIDPPAAETVRHIFSLAASGESITRIARRLNDDGVETPSVYLAAVRGGRYRTRAFWTYESVRNILQNRIYTGDTVPFKSHVESVGSRRVRHVPEEQQEVIPETHEAIVSREQYYLARRTVRSNRKGPRTRADNPFTSLVFCGCCGNRLVKGRERNRSWLCASARYRTDSGCATVRIEDARLREIVRRAVETQCALLGERLQSARRDGQGLRSGRLALERERAALSRRLERLEGESLRRYEAYASGALSREEFSRARTAAASEAGELKLRLAVTERALASALEGERACTGEAGQVQDLLGELTSGGITEGLAAALIRRITVEPGGAVRIEWNFRDGIADAGREKVLSPA